MAWKGIKPTKYVLKMIEESEDHVKKVVTVGLQSVIIMSPVMDAMYRSNHRLSINDQVFYTVPTTGNTAPKGNMDQQVFQDGLKNLLRFQLGDSICIQNNSAHGLRLENGWSDQAPMGVYSIAYMNMVNT